MAIAAQAFFSRVSDPRFGGTYLTLLNTTTNMGSQWPISVCLWAVDVLTINSCTEDPITVNKELYNKYLIRFWESKPLIISSSWSVTGDQICNGLIWNKPLGFETFVNVGEE